MMAVRSKPTMWTVLDLLSCRNFFKERNIDLQKENLLNEELQEIEIFDKPGLFSNGRLRDEDVPDGLYRYDLRGSDYDPGQPITVEKTVVVNHAASVLMAEELDLGADGRLELGEEGLNFTGAELTVREFMEEQQQKNNALIHSDSYHIAVEGHIGTWYAIDETEIGGEKFFLLEHEEHGDMAACVAVNEQGKLVAEDLWNGFDEDFQEAVKKYFSGKWNMPKKEDVVSEIIEKSAPVLDNSAQDYSDVPVYYEPFSYAKENDEVDLYRTSYRLNCECKQAIQEAIADNYDGMYLGDGAVDQVVKQYGMERVGYILANTLRHKSYDGRFSPGNKEWAEQVSTPEHNADRMTFRTDWVVDSHPAILDGFVTMFREELDAQKEQEQPFVKQFYVVENLQDAPLKIERFGNLDDAMSQYQALPNHYMKALGVGRILIRCRVHWMFYSAGTALIPLWRTTKRFRAGITRISRITLCNRCRGRWLRRMWNWPTNCRMPISISRPVTMVMTMPYIIRTSRSGMAVSSKWMEMSLCRRL